MTTNPFGTNPPTIPTIADMGNAALVDDPEYAPIPTQQPTADQLNLHDLCSAGAAMMMPFLRVRCTWDGISAYTVHSVQSLNPNLLAANVTLTKTGTGKIGVAVTSGKLPASSVLPRAWANDTGVVAKAVPTSTGANVELYATSEVYADSTFEIEIWGHS